MRSVWKHEANDFTKWLSEEENLNTLGDEIEIDIELISTEAKTSSFSADILAIESNINNKIIIENQLEATNYNHLGKIKPMLQVTMLNQSFGLLKKHVKNIDKLLIG